jgi:hypothetical protein
LLMSTMLDLVTDQLLRTVDPKYDRVLTRQLCVIVMFSSKFLNLSFTHTKSMIFCVCVIIFKEQMLMKHFEHTEFFKKALNH